MFAEDNHRCLQRGPGMEHTLLHKIIDEDSRRIQNNFYIFHRYTSSSADILMLVSLMSEACTKFKRTKISEDIAH